MTRKKKPNTILSEERFRRGWTQQDLADMIGTTPGTINRWETGKTTPTLYYRHKLCEILNKSEKDLGLVDLSMSWTDQQVHNRIDWGGAFGVHNFYGREQEQGLLTQWVMEEHCRVVSILGMGGIGKSALATSVMHQLATHFQFVIFRSLRDAPSCEVLLDDCLQLLSSQPCSVIPTDLEQRISLLLEHFHTSRVLLVLDNLETLMEKGNVIGRLRPEFEGYERLLLRVGETQQQSCMLLTSREKLTLLRPLEGKYSPVRSLRLSGLDNAACERLFAEKNVVGTPQDSLRLTTLYAGNPLALKIVAETIVDVFGGEISQFLSDGTMIFGSISELLSEQFSRLSTQEQTVLRWLAIIREPASIAELQEHLVTSLPHVKLLETIDSLRRRSLIERGELPATFTLQSVVLEYVTTVLIAEATSEIEQRTLDRLIHYSFAQGHAKEYVRQTQEQLLLKPVLANLQNVYEQKTVERILSALLNQIRQQASTHGYGPANLIALLRIHLGHLRGIDLSLLNIRAAYMQGVEMQDTSLVGASLHNTVFTQAHDAIWGIAIDSKGTLWAAGSRRGEVRIWSEQGRTLHQFWQAHTDITPTLAFHPNGKILATGSWDGTVKLWNVDNGSLLWVGNHTSTICVAWSPDGRLLASGARDTTIKVWDVASGTNIQTLLHHTSGVYSLAFSPDGSLASGDFDGTICLWEQEQKVFTCVQVLKGHTNMVKGLAWSPDGKLLATGSWDYTIKLWDIARGTNLQTLLGHTNMIHHLAWSPDGRLLASCSIDKTIRLWKQDGTQRALHGHTAAVYSIAFTPDSCAILSGSEDGTLRLWDVARSQCIRVQQGHTVSFQDIDWSPDGTQLISGGTDGQVIIWDIVNKSPLKVLHGHSWIIGGVAWSPDGKWVASCEWHTVIRLWNPITGICSQELRDPIGAAMGMVQSPDGRSLACGTTRHGAQVWDIATCSLRWTGRIHTPVIRHVSWSPDGSQLSGGGDDGNVYLWSATDGTLLQQFQGHHGIVMRVVWSPDGTQLASCGGSSTMGEVFLWKMPTGEHIQTLTEQSGIIYTIIWSPDGSHLISGGSDGKLRWWKAHSGVCIHVREAHQGTVQSLRISPDGHRLASCGDDGTITIWDLRCGKHLQTLRRDRPYERLNITGVRGLSKAQIKMLHMLGAIKVQSSENC